MRPRAALVAVSILALAGVALGAQAVPSSSAAYLARVTNSINTTATAPYFTCAGATNATAERAGAIFVFPLNENGISYLLGATDQSGHANGTYRGAFATSTTTPLACPRDAGGAYVLNGSSSYVTSPTQLANPTTFSAEVWFKTTVASGKLIGFGNSNNGTSSQFDRHIYLSTTGQLVFGVYNGGTNVITSPLAYTNGAWHHVVATMSPSAGMSLYVDGALVASSATFTVPENTTGYWRVGYDSLSGWPSTGTNYYFTGQMRWAAAYSIALTPAQVAAHYNAGR
ncbi:MAG: signal peptidase I [Micrococcales bacterium 70-64]|nr:LamG domain-containing protein [Leifsonia sp.]ODU64225.1 MAG: signal peptidase I [Leifsonia sp. SCN 70-46]OJX85915.1 MAG: signal peptidase I [Micrococcales bacterium 70-64]